MSLSEKGEVPPAGICGHCGAPAPFGARRCSYCRVELRNLRCGRCYHWSAATALHCGGCGYQLGLQPTPEPAGLTCAVCSNPLFVFSESAGRLYDCSDCGGQMLEPHLFTTLIRETLALTEPYAPKVPRANPLHAPLQYRRCPVCRQHMNRKNFGHSSGVIVDVCTQHGTWLDTGELPFILSFVRAGGLALAERRAREESARRSTTALAPVSGAGVDGGVDLDVAAVVAETGLAILEWVAATFVD